MKNKLISLFTLFIFLITALSVPVYAVQDFRNRLSLVPVTFDETGVAPDSAYILSGECGDNPIITINETITTTVTKSENNTYSVVPNAPLTYNKLYTFKLDRETPITWTFQTAERFCVAQTLPGTDGSNVPINTGIEITFSHADFDIADIQNNFSIKPAVGGKWEQHKKTAVFVPEKPLEYSTEYTVTLNQNTNRSDGDSLSEDYTYTFTTADPPEKNKDDNNSFQMYISRDYHEVSSTQPASVNVRAHSKNSETISSKVEVFKLDTELALSYLSKDINLQQISEQKSVSVMSFNYEMNMEYYNFNIQLPDTLKSGFYLMCVSANDKSAYTVIQATDISAYINSDTDNYAVWINHFTNGNAIKNVTLSLEGGSTKVKTDKDGLALLPKEDNCSYIKAVTPNGQTAYFPTDDYYRISKKAGKNKYRTVLQTDRTLYKPDDTVEIWGAVMPIDKTEVTGGLTAELYRGHCYYYDPTDVTMAVSEIAVNNDGTYTGELQLPNLSAGYYCMFIKYGDEAIDSIYFTVEEYVKPAYKLSLTADKKAIFYGESINYTAETTFFDGTAAAELPVTLTGSNYNFDDVSEQISTDLEGNAGYSVTPILKQDNKDEQGRATFKLSAYSTMPEIGDISCSTNTTVLLNNISMKLDSGYMNGTSTFTLHSDQLTTDKVNSGTDYDYIDSADKGRKINAALSFNRYQKEQIDTYYDYISKKSYPIYRYYTTEEKISDFVLTTDSEGNASYSFNPAEFSGGYYSVDITAVDDLGRSYTDYAYITTNEEISYYNYYPQSLYSDRYYVNTDKEVYDIGDTAEITVTKGTEPASERILYIKDYNGIVDMKVTDNGKYTTTFNELPYAFVSAVVFVPGKGYDEIATETLDYDTENSRLTFDVSTDKDSYAPGDSCTLNITAKDTDGKGISAELNVSVVDEALFELSNYNPETLKNLYADFHRVTSYYGYCSHAAYSYVSVGLSTAGGGSAETASGIVIGGASNGIGSTAKVRSEFKDTAVFISTKTDENGNGSVTFTLPDNITSWRATVSGFTQDMKAGNATHNIIVSMPAFLSYNLNKSFMQGDTPVVGVTLYGSDLTGAENITFVAYDGIQVVKADGHPFERINLPLSMTDVLGERTVTVAAETDNTLIDSLQTKIEIVDTYNYTEQAVYYNSPFEPITGYGENNVRIIFTDKNKSSLLDDVFWLRRRAGDRLDQRIASQTASELLNTYYDYNIETKEINWKDYQSSDGGMKLFTYGDSDIDATAKLTPYLKEYVDTNKLSDYLYSHVDEPRVLYALAVLREPVLNYLSSIAKADNLAPSDYLYIALAYCELGEYGLASDIFTNRIEGIIETYGNQKRIRTGVDNDDILESTSLAALAALYLGRDDAEALYNYSISNHTEDILINIERLAYISTAVKTLPTENGSVSYELYGETYTKEFRGGESYSVTVPAQNIPLFKVLSASDSVNMLSVSRVALVTEETLSPDITITRSYFKKGESEPSDTFFENDIVKVQFDVMFSDQVSDGHFVINDYLPSGLAPIDNSNYGTRGAWSNGQQVYLYPYPGANNQWSGYYYARVVNPGTFTADNATIQNCRSTDILAATDRTQITINGK